MSILVFNVTQIYWQDVFAKLAEKNVHITHALAKFPPYYENFSFFLKSKVKLIDETNFFNLDKVITLNSDDPYTLDREVLDYFAKVERDYYILTDRANYFPKSFRYQKRLFRETIRFWLKYLQAEKISFVFSACAPHELGDFVLYHAAKYLNIPTLHFNFTLINDHIQPVLDYRNLPPIIPDDYLKEFSNEEIAATIPQLILSSAFSLNKCLEYVKYINDQAMSGSRKYTVDDFAAKNSKDLGYKIAKKTPIDFNIEGLDNYRVKQTILFEICTKKTRQKAKADEKKRIQKLKESYAPLCTEPDLNKKYIFFAPHCQPERTSTPEAEMFEDQTLVIDILAKSVPSGWFVYVKEHPAQFSMGMNLHKSVHARDVTDYKNWARHKNVILVRADFSSDQLIASAQIVSTLNGSVGWEALQQQKPVIVFSPAWYLTFPSVRKANNINECKQAIADLSSKTKEEMSRDMLRFLAFVKDRFVIGNQGEESEITTITLTYEQHVQSMADYVSDFVKSRVAS